jgi:bacterioferritin
MDMKGDPNVIEYLNRSLKHELTAVNQYWLHYRLLENWGFIKLAEHERAESIEEMQHADKLIARIIFLDGQPRMQMLDPLMIGQDIKAVLECDLKAENSARALYIEARAICHEAKDYVTMELFESLLQDEEGHIDFLETQIDLINKIGLQNYGLLQSKAANEGEKND